MLIIQQWYAPKRNPLDEHKRQWQRRKHQYPNFESHKINISCILHVLTISVSLSRHAAEILWVLDAFLTDTTIAINLTRKMTSRNGDHDHAYMHADITLLVHQFGSQWPRTTSKFISSHQ